MSRCTDVTRRGLPHPDHMDGQDRLGYEQRLALELAAIGQRLVTISSEMRERSASVAVAPPPVPPVVPPPVAPPPHPTTDAQPKSTPTHWHPPPPPPHSTRNARAGTGTSADPPADRRCPRRTPPNPDQPPPHATAPTP